MTDYTPSTDEVRAAYAGYDFDPGVGEAQFDRWLAEVKRAAASPSVVLALLERLERAEAAIERVRALHKRDVLYRELCEECSDFGTDQHPPGQMVEWPCSTVAALDTGKEKNDE